MEVIILKDQLLYEKFPALDGLRAISIFLVIIHHLPIPYPRWIEFIRVRGDLGVEIFFAISGFLVMRSLYQCSLKNKDLWKLCKTFFVRRFSRIFPGYYTILIILIVLSFFVNSLKEKLSSIMDIWISFPLYFYNYAKSFTAGEIPASLNITWSLAFEEQFYIILFLTFILFKKINWALAGLILFSIISRIIESLTQVEMNIQMHSHIRFDAILWGCLLWNHIDLLDTFYKKYRFLLIPFFSLLTCVVFFFHHHYSENLYISINYIGISLSTTFWVYFFLKNRFSPLHIILTNPLIVIIGVASYELYLIHQILNGFASPRRLR